MLSYTQVIFIILRCISDMALWSLMELVGSSVKPFLSLKIVPMQMVDIFPFLWAGRSFNQPVQDYIQDYNQSFNRAKLSPPTKSCELYISNNLLPKRLLELFQTPQQMDPPEVTSNISSENSILTTPEQFKNWIPPFLHCRSNIIYSCLSPIEFIIDRINCKTSQKLFSFLFISLLGLSARQVKIYAKYTYVCTQYNQENLIRTRIGAITEIHNLKRLHS